MERPCTPRQVHEWRGRCISLFADLENEVTLTLAQLRTVGHVRIHKQPGPRIKQLIDVMDAIRPDRKASSLLAEWSELIQWRNVLAHGQITHAKSPLSGWTMTELSIVDGQARWTASKWTPLRAALFLHHVDSKAKPICARLRLYRKRLLPA